MFFFSIFAKGDNFSDFLSASEDSLYFPNKDKLLMVRICYKKSKFSFTCNSHIHVVRRQNENGGYEDEGNKQNISRQDGGGRLVRRCWVNFQCRGVLLIWIIVGQGPVALAVGAGGGCLDIFFSHLSFLSFFFLSLSLWETARYRLKYCLKGPLNPKQPTNQNPGRTLYMDFN